MKHLALSALGLLATQVLGYRHRPRNLGQGDQSSVSETNNIVQLAQGPLSETSDECEFDVTYHGCTFTKNSRGHGIGKWLEDEQACKNHCDNSQECTRWMFVGMPTHCPPGDREVTLANNYREGTIQKFARNCQNDGTGYCYLKNGESDECNYKGKREKKRKVTTAKKGKECTYP